MTIDRRHRLLVTGATLLAALMIGVAPAAAEDVIDRTPRPDGGPVPVECGLAPGLQVTPGAARTATTFNIGEIAAALGPDASMPLFYVDFGDGTAESAPGSVVPVTASSRGGALIVGTAAGVIVERNSKPSARSENNAPLVPASSGQTVLVNVPFLPAMTFMKAGTYTVRLGVAGGPRRYVKVMVK